MSRLQENATSFSCPHPVQRSLRKPWARMQHSGKLELGALARLWQTVAAELPNRRTPQPAAWLVDLGTRTDAPALQRLFAALA